MTTQANDAFNRNKTKEAKLGQLITEPGEQNQRDAVHIAVVPVKAAYKMMTGQAVGVTPDGKTAGIPGAGYSEAVGIVDPFLKCAVGPGDVFWLFLYQGHVTTLRHEWTHPAFPNLSEVPVAPAATDLRLEAKRRMQAFIIRECAWRNYHEFIAYAKDVVECGGSVNMGDNDGVQAYPGFMADLALLTNSPDIKDQDPPYFSCAC